MQAHVTSVVCKMATLECQTHKISIGEGTIVHPRAIIRATNGSITIGKFNIIEENALVENLDTATMTIGDGNIFQPLSEFRGVSLGNDCTLEPKSRVAQGVKIGSGCAIGMNARVLQELTDNTVCYLSNGLICLKRLPASSANPDHMKHCQYLAEVLPRYNHLISS